MESVWHYSAAQWGSRQTERCIDDLAAAFKFLAENQNAGSTCAYIRTGYRKYPVKRHVIYYRVTGYGIEIMRVLHDRMLAAGQF